MLQHIRSRPLLIRILQHPQASLLYTPVFAFLDIESVYNTVNSRIIWKLFTDTMVFALSSLLHNFFIEVILANPSSYRTQPVTYVLQGSILSPFLYSYYINSLPLTIRSNPLNNDDLSLQLALFISCLLYANNVALIATANTLQPLSTLCEQHSQFLGYRKNPTKCVILSPSDESYQYTLYNQLIPKQDIFFCPGIPFKLNGIFALLGRVCHNTNKADRLLQLFSSIGLNSSGFSKLLACRIYQ
jgi:hypothetical protein